MNTPALDAAILAVANDFSFDLWDHYGAPSRKTVDEIAQKIDRDETDIWYSMKRLRREGKLDDFGMVPNPASYNPPTGFFDARSVMRGDSTRVPIEPLPDKSSIATLIDQTIQEFGKTTELGYEFVHPDIYSPEEIARLTAKTSMSATDLLDATNEVFDSAVSLAGYLDACWVKLGAATADRWTKRIKEARNDFEKFLEEFTRPMRNTDVDLVRIALAGTLRNLERMIENALGDLAKNGSTAPELNVPNLIQNHIDALRKAIDRHVPKGSELEIIPAIQSELAQRIERTAPEGFPEPLTETSLHGIVGDFVSSSLPHTEADENALAYQFLAAVGNLFGRNSYATFGADRHYPNLFLTVVGSTSAGKGQSLSAVRSCLSQVDPTWLDRMKHSAASGEALVRMVSEAEDDPRMLVVLSEMSVLLNSANRDGSNLSGYLRIAYDGAPLEHNKAQKSYRATDYVLSTIGHITPQELSETMTNVDFYNGSTNRFLFAAVKRSKVVPRMSSAPDFRSLAERIENLLALPGEGKVGFSAEGGRTWDAWVYSLTEPSDGKLAAAVERSKPNALRVALIYALLDETRLNTKAKCEIDTHHVRAAIEIVNRSRQSVKWFLDSSSTKTGNTTLEDILKVKTATNASGGILTGTQLAKLFSRKTLDERNELATRAGLKMRKIAADKTGPATSQWSW
jgi:hypothetical protein